MRLMSWRNTMAKSFSIYNKDLFVVYNQNHVCRQLSLATQGATTSEVTVLA